MNNTAKTKQQLIEELAALQQRIEALEQTNIQQTRYSQLFERHPAIMLLINPGTGAIVDANSAACAFYGYPRTTLIALNIDEINMLPAPLIQAEMHRAQTEQRNYFVFPHKLASGDIRMVAVRSGPVMIGPDMLLCSIIHDITDRLQTEQDLRISEARYRLLVDHIPDSIVILYDHDLRFVLVGGPEARHGSFFKDQVEGRRLHEAIPAPYTGDFEGNMRAALAGASLEMEVLWQETDWYRYFFVPVADDAGDIYMAMILGQNITAQKQADQLAQASEERYRRLSELTSDYAYAYRVNADGELALEWHTQQAFERITGYCADDFDQTINIYHPDDLPRYQQDMADLLAGHPTETECRIITKSGELRWLHMSRRPVWDENGERVVRFYGAAKDITDRKRSDTLALANEARYRRLSELTSDYAYSYQVTAAGEYLLDWITEESWERITGYTTEDFEHTISLYHPDDLTRFQKDMAQLLAGRPTESEYRIITKSGELRWLQISRQPVWDEQEGRVISFYGTAKDVTDRKQTEVALRESEERYRMISVMVSDFTYYYRVNPDQTCTYEWGDQQALYDISGYQPAEIIESFVVYHPADRERVLQDIYRVIAGEAHTEEYRILTKNGDLRWVRTQRQPVWDEREGRVVGFYGATRDITQDKQAEQTRLAFAVERERVDILSNFITHASHEFRTPLAVINTSTHLLKRLTDPARHQQQIATIEQQVSHINKLVDNLITLAGLDNIRELPSTTINLVEVLYMVNDTMQVAQQEKDLTIVFDLCQDNFPLQGNISYLIQAVQQIWENAIQHSPAGVTLTIGLQQQAEQAVITIADHGAGISAEALPKIFTRFFRTDQAGTARGFGLGLPIAQAIVNLHGGSILVESEPGQGCTVSILLPLE